VAANNKLYISNSQTSSPLIYGDFYDKVIKLNGSVTVNGVSQFNGGTSVNSELVLRNPSPDGLVMDIKNTGDYQIIEYGKVDGPSVWQQKTSQSADPAASFLSLRYYSNNNSNDAGLTIYGTGDAELFGNLTELSDARYKKNISSLTGTLNRIQQLRGVTYNWIDKGKDTTEQIGFIAQEVEKVFLQLVRTNNKGYKSVAYSHMVPVLLQAIKEQQAEIEELKKMIQEKNH
jgi:hypothetical protein